VLNEYGPNIRRIFELAAQHVSLYAIAKTLTRDGLKPPISDTWRTSYISKVLRNDAAIGTYRPMKRVAAKDHVHTGEVVLNHYPALISADLLKRANDAKRTKHASTGAKGKFYTNLFTGFCHCGECGSAMKLGSVYTREKTISYLICTGKLEKGTCKTLATFAMTRFRTRF